MSRAFDPAVGDFILPLIHRPQGFRSLDALHLFSHGMVARALARFERAQQAYPARVSRKHVQWFATEAQADAYLRQYRGQPRSAMTSWAMPVNVFNRPTPMPGSGALVSPGNARRGAACWNPKARPGDPDYVEPHYPTDEQGRPLYRITRSAPVQPITRSNTHAE